jgi:hypothetical protein
LKRSGISLGRRDGIRISCNPLDDAMEIRDPPAHRPVRGQIGSVHDHLAQLGHLRLCQVRHTACTFPAFQGVNATLVVPMHPIPQQLTVHAIAGGRLAGVARLPTPWRKGQKTPDPRAVSPFGGQRPKLAAGAVGSGDRPRLAYPMPPSCKSQRWGTGRHRGVRSGGLPVNRDDGRDSPEGGGGEAAGGVGGAPEGSEACEGGKACDARKAAAAKPQKTKAAKATKPQPTKIEIGQRGTLGARLRELIGEGLDNDAIWAIVSWSMSLRTTNVNMGRGSAATCSN